MREFRQDHSLPLFVTLIVVAFLIMTFDLRAGGTGILGSLRAGTNNVVQPIEGVVQTVIDPIADFVDGLADIASLRQENEALRASLAEALGELAAVGDKLQRLDTLENLLTLPLNVQEFSTTLANVTGRADSFDLSFRIDKGLADGVLVGQPVLDDNGNLVGRVLEAWEGGATVIPITGDVEAVTVSIGGMDGIASAIPGASELELNRDLSLDVFVGAQVVGRGDRVVTSRFSSSFPPGVAVGTVKADASPQGQNLTARVEPFFDYQSLRAVIIVVWPADPGVPTLDDVPVSPSTTATGEQPPVTG